MASRRFTCFAAIFNIMAPPVETLITQGLALVVALFTIFWGTRLALFKERRQLLWSKELERFLALEELAGQLVEDLASYRTLDRSNLGTRLEELHQAAGRFARYDDLRRAILQLHNTLGRMFVAKRDFEVEEQEIRSELYCHLKQLLSACDQITERDKLDHWWRRMFLL
jgi:hypothetical protein